MNTTTNYNLPQWEDTDRVTRESVNGAMSSIDSAIANASPWVKLLDVTLGADTTRYDLDVSGIDFKKYAVVMIFPFINSGGNCFIRLNNVSANNSYYLDGNRTNRVGILGTYNNVGWLSLYPMTNELGVMSNSFREGKLFQNGGKPDSTSIASPTNLQTINFCPESVNVKAGSRFVVYGLKL